MRLARLASLQNNSFDHFFVLFSRSMATVWYLFMVFSSWQLHRVCLLHDVYILLVLVQIFMHSFCIKSLCCLTQTHFYHNALNCSQASSKQDAHEVSRHLYFCLTESPPIIHPPSIEISSRSFWLAIISFTICLGRLAHPCTLNHSLSRTPRSRSLIRGGRFVPYFIVKFNRVFEWIVLIEGVVRAR